MRGLQTPTLRNDLRPILTRIMRATRLSLLPNVPTLEKFRDTKEVTSALFELERRRTADRRMRSLRRDGGGLARAAPPSRRRLFGTSSAGAKLAREGVRAGRASNSARTASTRAVEAGDCFLDTPKRNSAAVTMLIATFQSPTRRKQAAALPEGLRPGYAAPLTAADARRVRALAFAAWQQATCVQKRLSHRRRLSSQVNCLCASPS